MRMIPRYKTVVFGGRGPPPGLPAGVPGHLWSPFAVGSHPPRGGQACGLRAGGRGEANQLPENMASAGGKAPRDPRRLQGRERDTCLWPGGTVCFLHRVSRGRDRSGGACLNISSRGGSIHHQVANSMRSKSTLPVAHEVGEAPGVFIREVTVPRHWLWAGGCVPGGDGGALGGRGARC